MRKHTISFINAFKGIWTAVYTQPNLRIHFVIGSLVLFFASYFQLSFDKVVDLILAIMIVMVVEMINTSIEFLSDAVTLEQNEHIKLAKDVSAGAVLVSAIYAIIIGIVIFLPVLI